MSSAKVYQFDENRIIVVKHSDESHTIVSVFTTKRGKLRFKFENFPKDCCRSFEFRLSKCIWASPMVEYVANGTSSIKFDIVSSTRLRVYILESVDSLNWTRWIQVDTSFAPSGDGFTTDISIRDDTDRSIWDRYGPRHHS